MGFFGAPRRNPQPEAQALGEAYVPLALPSDGELSGFMPAPPAEAAADFAFAEYSPGTIFIDPTAPAPGVNDWSPGEDGNQRRVQVIGNGFEVDGTLVTGKFDRLSDWLNMQQGWIHLGDGALFRPGEEHAEPDPQQRADQWVRLDEVVLVAEHQPDQTHRGGAPGYVRKQRRRVTIVTHGYVLRGYMHLVQSGTMQSFLESADPHFLPMTDVVVRWLADERLVSHLPFALVNRGQLISVSEEAQRTEPGKAEAEAVAEPPADEPPAWLRSA